MIRLDSLTAAFKDAASETFDRSANMPRYANGTKAKIGDIVKGHGYNVRHEIIGKVVNIRPGEGCTLSVAHVGLDTQIPDKGTLAAPFAPCEVMASVEYGDTKGFDKIA